jgi:hypothetical protein
MRPGTALRLAGAIASGIVSVSSAAGQSGAAAAVTAEARAVAYLAAEVPRWRREHPCYSCHNNGDASRALLEAERRGLEIGAALDDTLAWLSQPGKWDGNATAGGFDDKALAHVQFAGALTAAAGRTGMPVAALHEAARIVARDQAPDGSWPLDVSQSIGSPVTYGTALATASALRTLETAALPEHADVIDRGRAWLRTLETKNVLDSSAVALGLAQVQDPPSRARRERALALVERAQAPDGGWGLYETSPSEAFDTALALLALLPVDEPPQRREMVARGRRFLIERQLSDGSWPETTRPSGQESYAQRISTTGWATLALLMTEPVR